MVKFLKNYVNSEKIEISIEIQLWIAQNWLYKLGFEYKHIYKNIFINGYEYLNVVKNRNNFLIKIEDLKPYIVEFEENDKIKSKIYLLSCIIRKSDWQPIIIITYDECTFSINNSIKKTWTKVENTFLQLKGHGQGIMISEFLFSFD